MNKIYVLAVGLGLWIGGGTYWYTCHVKMLCENQEGNLSGTTSAGSLQTDSQDPISSSQLSDDASLQAKPLEINLGNGRMLKFPDGIYLLKDDRVPVVPSPSKALYDSLYNFMKFNPHSSLEIIASYGKDEASEHSPSNLGLLRAANIRDTLVARGCNPDRILMVGKIGNLRFTDKGRSAGGIDFLVAEIRDPELEKKVEKGIAEKRLFFPFADANFIEDPTLQAYSLELKDYLEKYPKKKVKIYGYTDSEGGHWSNYHLSKKRAKEAMYSFTNAGIPPGKFIIKAKGEKDPVADNETDAGRAQNRRVEIKVE